MRYVPYQTPNNGTAYQSVPTIGNIGGYGYSPYQSGYYNQYYNPYYIRQQQEAQKRLQIQETQNQMEIWSKLINCSNAALGYDAIDKQTIFNQIQERAHQYQQQLYDDRQADDIYRITQQAHYQQLQSQNIQESIERQNQETIQEQESREAKTLIQWLHEDAQDRYIESKRAQAIHSQRNTSNLYNSSSYNQLLSAHDSIFSSLNRDVNIDDMEIQVNLPERLRLERDIRRQKFAESLRRGL